MLKNKIMKKQKTKLTYVVLTGIILLLSTTITSAQIGINTITPANGSILDIESSEKGVMIPRMDITDLTTIAPVTGITGPVEEAAAEGLMVYNTFAGTGTGFHFWNGTDWTPVSGAAAAEPPVDSASLAADVLINSTTNVPIPLTLTFTARKSSVLVMLTASGLGFTGSIATGTLTVENTTLGTTVGGTNMKIQNYSSIAIFGPGNSNGNNSNATYTTTSWNASFSKLMTGLTIGVTYTLSVQGRSASILGTNGFAIQPLTTPDAQHLTLSVIQ